MGTNKEGAINNKRSVLVTTLNNFVVTNNCVREFTTNSLDMGTRRTVKTNNTMLPSTPTSTSTSWTTPSPHPTTQTWSPTESTPTTRLPSTSTSWTPTPSQHRQQDCRHTLRHRRGSQQSQPRQQDCRQPQHHGQRRVHDQLHGRGYQQSRPSHH